MIATSHLPRPWQKESVTVDQGCPLQLPKVKVKQYSHQLSYPRVRQMGMTPAPLHTCGGKEFKAGPSVIFHSTKHLNFLPWRSPWLLASGENKLIAQQAEAGSMLAAQSQAGNPCPVRSGCTWHQLGVSPCQVGVGLTPLSQLVRVVRQQGNCGQGKEKGGGWGLHGQDCVAMEKSFKCSEHIIAYL